jgi:hypothetical protein
MVKAATIRSIVAGYQGVYRRLQLDGAAMKFEVVESEGAWIVRRNAVEIGRFAAQDEALRHVGEVMRDLPANDGPSSLAVRYERRSA